MMMPRSSSGGRLSIAAVTKKIDVDNRISLRYYNRIADNILKQVNTHNWSCFLPPLEFLEFSHAWSILVFVE